jgi:hypothetical protein
LLRVSEQEEGQLGDDSGFFRGEVPQTRRCPFLSAIHPHPLRRSAMIFEMNYAPDLHVSRLLQEASSRTGFAIADIEALVESELETGYLLEYITAVLNNRTN